MPPSILSQAARVLATVLIACAEPPPPEREPEPAPRAPPTIEEAWSWPLRDLSRAANDLGADAADRAGTDEGVASGRHAAALARVLSLRDPDGADWIARSRAWLGEASRRRALDGACDAALERIASRFARSSGSTTIVVSARRAA
jgi:hypothetical protein